MISMTVLFLFGYTAFVGCVGVVGGYYIGYISGKEER